jgi:hypothetical protein
MLARIICIVFALGPLACADSKGNAGDQGTGGAATGGMALGAAEVFVRPPASSVPNIGTRTSCSAGATGIYTYFLGSMPSGFTARDRVVGARVPNGGGFTVGCKVLEEGDQTVVEVSILGPDANTRRTPASLTLQGAIPTVPSEGALSAGSFYSPDTGELGTDPSLPGCVLTNGAFVEDGLVADFSCPALVKSDNAFTGCEATGSVAFSGCRR